MQALGAAAMHAVLIAHQAARARYVRLLAPHWHHTGPTLPTSPHLPLAISQDCNPKLHCNPLHSLATRQLNDDPVVLPIIVVIRLPVLQDPGQRDIGVPHCKAGFPPLLPCLGGVLGTLHGNVLQGREGTTSGLRGSANWGEAALPCLVLGACSTAW